MIRSCEFSCSVMRNKHDRSVFDRGTETTRYHLHIYVTFNKLGLSVACHFFLHPGGVEATRR